MTTALIIRDDASLSASITPDAVAIKEQALAEGAVIFAVRNPDENAAATAAQAACCTVLKMVEDQRVALKKPILDYGRAIDGAANHFKHDLEMEEARIARLIGNYQTELSAQRRAEEAKEQKKLHEIERRRQEELAKAATHDERDAIDARANEEAKAAKPPLVEVKAAGQVLPEDWEISNIREWELARSHPELVRSIEFDMRQVKAALTLLGSLPGVTAKKVVKASVRLPSAGKGLVLPV